MKKLAFLIVIFFLEVCATSGCSKPVYIQKPRVIQKEIVPISSTPLQAEVYADGAFVGYTPLSVELAKNRSHIITLTKKGFKPASVSIIRRRDETKVYTKALRKGLESASFFDDFNYGIREANDTMEADEETGAAYQFEPSTVIVTLEPEKPLEANTDQVEAQK